jgi:two-component system, cell cycle sensor histidine kinase and response regulator CckA
VRSASVYRDQSETLLLVEDQDVVRKLVRRLLQADGYTVLEARDGREAMGICASHPGPIELMVTDLNMPQMGGQELAREAVRVRPALKVLFISGFSADEAGVGDESIPGLSPEFLQKPFNPVELARKIRAVLDAPSGNGRRG